MASVVSMMQLEPARPAARAGGGAAVSLRGLEKSFGGRKVLREVSLDIEQGRFVSIVGRSGSGKTTLLRIIAGLDTADSGDLAIHCDESRGGNSTVRLMF